MVNMSPLPPELYTPEDTAQYKALSEKDVMTLFIYNKNYWFAGERRMIDEQNSQVRTEMRGGVSVVPVELFTLFDGVHLEGSTLARGEKEVALDQCGFAVKPFDYRGHLYVPAKETAEALGLKAISGYKDRVTAVGTPEKIEKITQAMKRNEAIAVAAADLVIGKYDAYKFTSSDYKIARDKWRRFLVGSPESIDLKDEGIIKKLKTLEKDTEELLDTMNRGDAVCILWGDKPPVLSNELYEQYINIGILAKAFGTYGTKYYQNEAVKNDILFALKWMYENMYGVAELEDRGWRSIHKFNWWYWYVGAPEHLTDIILIMYDHLTKEQISDYLMLFKWLLDNWRLNYNLDQSPSRVCTGAKYAIIAEDPERLTIAANDYHIMLDIVLSGEGTRPDYCYYCHGYPYSLGYGFMLTDRVLKVAVNFAGTPLEYGSYRAYDQFMLVRNMFDAAMFQGRGFQCFRGRGTTAPDTQSAWEAVCGVVPMLGCYGPEEDDYIRRFAKYCMESETAREIVKEKCTISAYPVISNILRDDTIPFEDDRRFGYAWFTADRAVLHREKYALVVSMPSYRHFNYECINHSNKMGWYMHDGTLYLYTKTDPQEFWGENFVLNPRLAHRMPGTTVDVRERPAVSISEGWVPENDRVGCMDFDGQYVIAGMDYTCYNKATEDTTYIDTGYGGGHPKFPNDLVAKKAYFMFGDTCVCLGAGINSTMNAAVNTIVEHRRLVKLQHNELGDDRISVNGETLENGLYEKVFTNPQYACVENFAGYLFLDAPVVSVSKYTFAYDKEAAEDIMVEGFVPDVSKKDRPFVEIMINHGKNPVNASYAYAVLPYADEEKLKKYAQNPDFEILSNTDRIQAVREKSTNTVGVMFYEAGQCAGVQVNKPCLVSFQEKDGMLKIKVCEPTNKADTVELEILKKLDLVSAHNRYSVDCGTTARLTLNTASSVGEGYEALFQVR